MRKVHDYIHSYLGISADEGRCRVCIFEQDGQTPVVVITGLTSSASTNISAVATFLAAEIVNLHFANYAEEEVPVRWFEHHERSEWELRNRLKRLRSWPVDGPLGASWSRRSALRWFRRAARNPCLVADFERASRMFFRLPSVLVTRREIPWE